MNTNTSHSISTTVVMLMGLDQTRFLEERALNFLKKYTDRIFKINMMDVEEEFKGY